MKNCLIIIGKDLIFNTPYKEYIEDEAKSSLINIDTTIYLSDHKEFLEELKYSINHFSNILVIVEAENYTTIAKFISTEKEDDLVLKDKLLVPSTAIYDDDNSFVVEVDKTNINLVIVEPFKELPLISLKNIYDEQTVHIFDLDKDSIEVLLKPIAEIHEVEFFTTECTKDWYVLKVSSKRFGNVQDFINSAKALLKAQMIVTENVIEHIIQKLEPLDKKISFAESCTGGMLASLFTSVSGISDIFDGSVVSYANEIKERWLSVHQDNLFHHGAVSKEVVDNMCNGILDASDADYGIAISGIAGPSGGSEDKPVGTVVIGVIDSNREKIIHECHFSGNRAYVQKQSCYYAIRLFIKIAKKDLF